MKAKIMGMLRNRLTVWVVKNESIMVVFILPSLQYMTQGHQSIEGLKIGRLKTEEKYEIFI